jgi:hypothetical protein
MSEKPSAKHCALFEHFGGSTEHKEMYYERFWPDKQGAPQVQALKCTDKKNVL